MIELIRNIFMVIGVVLVVNWICRKIDDCFFNYVEDTIKADDQTIRMAELFYHADGFLEMAKGNRLESPAPWIKEALEAEHSGDCMKQPWSCMRCHAEDYLAMATWVTAQLKLEKELRRDRY